MVEETHGAAASEIVRMISRRFIYLSLALLPIIVLVAFSSVMAGLDSIARDSDNGLISQLSPDIALAKTVALDPDSCGLTDALDIPAGTQVIYCYDVINTGTVTLTQHELVDSELGVLFDGTYQLVPGESISVTTAVTINTTTVNTATWTTYNPGPVDAVSSTDSATVTVVLAALITVDPQSLYSSQDSDELVIIPLELGNQGDIDLNWSIFEESQAVPRSLLKTSPPDTQTASRSRRMDVLTSKDQCEQYENYAGAEPVGYAENCLDGPPPRIHYGINSTLGPTDIAYAQDIGYISDNFVWHQLNDFPGQTVVGQQSEAIFGYDFDVTGQILYGVNDVTKQLGTIDLNNGDFTPIGLTFPITETLTGLTIHPLNGEAYVSTSDDDFGRIYSVDLSTGVLTLIGVGGDPNIPLLIDISINPAGVMYGHDIGTDSIYTIDVNTGVATLVGPTGVDSKFAQGMDFDNSDGTLYAWIYERQGHNQYGIIDLSSGAFTPLSIDNPLGEFEGATQTTVTGAFCRPSDIVWATIDPVVGIIQPGFTQTLEVTFDSSGMNAGTYSGTLCIDSNDFFNPILRVPITMVVEPAPAIEMEKTVGQVPNVCATTDTIEVPIGSEVTFCYRVFNTGNVSLSLHGLEDTELGVLLDEYNVPLLPGNSMAFLTDTIVYITTTNQAIWTAYNPGPSDIVTATDSATVSAVPVPIIVVDPSSLASSQGSDVQVTLPLKISNIGVVDLNWSFYGEGSVSLTSVTPALPLKFPPISPGAGPTILPYDTGHKLEATVIRDPAPSERAFVQYEKYFNDSPSGVRETYSETIPGQEVQSDELSSEPTDIAYAQDIGLLTDNFVWHHLNDFSGQNVIATSINTYYGMDFNPSATELYALRWDDSVPQLEFGELGTIDLATGIFSLIALSTPPSGNPWTGMSIHPIDGTIYASTATDLFTIDPATGTPSIIGLFGISSMIDIAVNEFGKMYGHDNSDDSIYSIDTATGMATLLGPTGVDSNFAQGMDFDNTDGTLYAWIYEGQGHNQYGTIDLSTGAFTPLSIDSPLGEFEGATQTTISSSFCTQPNSSWITVNPASGTVDPGGTQTVDVTFDSTGIAAGSYHLILCIENSDPNNPLVMVPVTLVVESAPSVDLVKTVGLEPMVCAETSYIEVPARTRVTYCFRATNMGNATLSLHDLYDTELRILLNDYVEPLLPGASITIYADAVINTTTTNQATWVSFNPGPFDVVYDIDTATVSVLSFPIYIPLVLKT